jgi:uncharacterized protein YbjQ (UPF0145 family)
MKKMIMTTTSTLEGWNIDSYIGIVSSHVVAGTGFLSDTLAGLSDIFGGRSKSYQNQLFSINEEAISRLVEQTALKGGNGIIGLKIDHDEISGKGKTMFMVTATATAVRVTKISGSSEPEDIIQNTQISTLELQSELRKNNILKIINSENSNLKDDAWEFLINNQVKEASSYVLNTLQNIATRDIIEDSKKHWIGLCSEYLKNLEYKDQQEILYSAIESHQSVFDIISGIIKETFTLSFDNLDKLLNHSELDIRKKGLILAQTDKPSYTDKDIENFQSLLQKIEQTFPVTAEFVEVKNKLGSGIKNKWKCTCETLNNEDLKICSSCKKDIYGFKNDEVKPAKVIDLLRNKITTLEKLLS